jgi:hypothetical protein
LRLAFQQALVVALVLVAPIAVIAYLLHAVGVPHLPLQIFLAVYIWSPILLAAIVRPEGWKPRSAISRVLALGRL